MTTENRHCGGKLGNKMESITIQPEIKNVQLEHLNKMVNVKKTQDYFNIEKMQQLKWLFDFWCETI